MLSTRNLNTAFYVLWKKSYLQSISDKNIQSIANSSLYIKELLYQSEFFNFGNIFYAPNKICHTEIDIIYYEYHFNVKEKFAVSSYFILKYF
jgi:hypothetical protein